MVSGTKGENIKVSVCPWAQIGGSKMRLVHLAPGQPWEVLKGPQNREVTDHSSSKEENLIASDLRLSNKYLRQLHVLYFALYSKVDVSIYIKMVCGTMAHERTKTVQRNLKMTALVGFGGDAHFSRMY